MMTKALLKQRIQDDLDRTDLATQISNAIDDAVRYYQSQRFFFNENRDTTFSTVPDQDLYDATDEPNIARFYRLDGVFCTVGGQVHELCQASPDELEILNDNSAAKGEPYMFARFADTIRFYPIPDQAYPIRLVGHLRIDSPADENEPDVPWFTCAFELMRCRAKIYLAMHVIRDPDLLREMIAAEQDALAALTGIGSQKYGSGRIRPTCF